MKKTIALIMILSMIAGLVSGCIGSSLASEQLVPMKTGLSVTTGLSKSKDATADEDGLAQADIVLCAVTVGDDGVIESCVIDTVQSKINFNAQGALATDASTIFRSKNQLGKEYGMHTASSIGKEWNEQMQALAAYVCGKTIEEVKGIAVDENDKVTDADLASSVTLAIGRYVSAIEAAVGNAVHLGAKKGDTLKLTSVTNMKKSKDATEEKDGVAQAYGTFAAVTFDTNGVISGCHIDAVQANVNFNTSGAITGDLTAKVRTKNELGDDYGMKAASGIGKEWYEQAAAFSAYVTGKSVADVSGIAVSEGKAADEELLASVTVSIGDFIELITMAE